MIESHLHTHLIEHLNSEIVLETITDIPSVLVSLYTRPIRNVKYVSWFSARKYEATGGASIMI